MGIVTVLVFVILELTNERFDWTDSGVFGNVQPRKFGAHRCRRRDRRGLPAVPHRVRLLKLGSLPEQYPGTDRRLCLRRPAERDTPADHLANLLLPLRNTLPHSNPHG